MKIGILAAGAAGVLAVVAAACGSKSSLGSQLAPTANLTVASLALTANPPPVGGVTQASATATYSNGSTGAVVTGFSTDAASVATTNASGRLTGVGIGDVTVIVDYQGVRATKTVRVLPGYAGVFSGTYTVSSCEESGDFTSQGVCAIVTAQPTLPIAFNTQQSADLTTVTGQFAIGQLVGNGEGTVAADGQFSYAGTFTTGTGHIALQDMRVTSTTPGQFSGTFRQVWTDDTLTGQATITCVMSTINRVGLAAAFDASLGRATVSPRVPMSVRDLLSAAIR
jgi:hypothetical protein